MRTLIALAAVILAVGGGIGVTSVTAADGVEITECEVTLNETRPRDPYVDGQGRVWFVGQRGDYVAYLEPDTGTFKRYDLDEGAGPHNLIVDDAGFVWYSGNRAAYIGRLDPANGEITRYPMPDPVARDPHTLVFDENADIWFTVQGGNFVGKLGTRTGAIQLIPVPTERARPYGIKVDADNRPWFVELGTNKLASVNPETLELTEIALPRAETRPRRLDLTSSGKLWYVDYAGGYLGSFDPVTGTHEEWLSPGGAASRPYGMAIDDQDRVWYVETGVDPNRFVGFDPRTNTFTETTDVPSGGGTVRHMYYDAPRRAIWFGTDTNNIGRARVP